MNIRFLIAILIAAVGLVSCSSSSFNTDVPVGQADIPSHYTDTSSLAFFQGNAVAVWEKILPFSTTRLNSMLATTTDPTARAWVQLALIAKQKNIDTPTFAKKLLAWREQNPAHPANQLFSDNRVLTQLQSTSPPQQIAILLPQNGTYQNAGQTVREGILNAYYTNLPHVGHQQVKFYDTTQASVITLYQRASAEGADFIIGPLIKEDVQQLRQLNNFNKPTLSLNYTNNSAITNFYEFGLLPEDEITQIANRAHQSGFSRALVIAPQNAWGKRLVSALSSHWQTLGGSIQGSWYYTSPVNFNQEIAKFLKVNPDADRKLMQENNDKTLLAHQRRQDFDVIFLFSQPAYARLIVPLLRYYYVSDTPIFATSSVYAGKPDPAKDADLNGVIICDIPRAPGKAGNRLYAVGQDAYRLSQSIPRLVAMPSFPLYGATGALLLSPQQQIHRRIPCVPVQNGLI
ncbi:MAG: penicillin-binding protein activator [Gammaproteobacteria bacterium]|nr:penicillin-binding protein activator [Gammaproteobacteria bacterium]